MRSQKANIKNPQSSQMYVKAEQTYVETEEELNVLGTLQI